MWNNWMDQAKSMAANLDKQLNESVGVEDSGNNDSATAATMSTTAAAATTTPMATATSMLPTESSPSLVPTQGVNTGNVADLNNTPSDDAWNDDFDDSAFDDFDNTARQQQQQQQPAPTTLATPEFKAVQVASEQVASPAPVSPVVFMPKKQEEIPAKLSVSNEEEVEEEKIPAVQPQQEGWGQEGDHNDIVVDDGDEIVDMQPATASPLSPDAPSKVKLPASLTTASSMLSSFGSSVAAVSSSATIPKTPNIASPSLSSLLSAATDKLAQVTSELDGNDETKDPATMASTDAVTIQQSQAEGGGEQEEGWDGDDDELLDITEASEAAEKEVSPTVAVVPEETTPEEKEVKATPPASTEPAPEKAEVAPPISPQSATPTATSQPTPPAAAEENAILPPSSESTTMNIEDDPRYRELQKQLELREGQLANKAEQMTQLEEMFASQEHELRQKIQETKDEAKKRIQRAKERCEAAEAKLNQIQSVGNESSAKQANLIAELRAEGEKLAMKQSVMEQAVRAAKSESRDLAEQLDQETTAKTNALEKIAKLEAGLKVTKESLSSARKGESQAGKLENDLLAARSDAEMKAATILSLQQQVKELSSEGKELREEIEKARKSAAQEAQQEKKTLRREHNDIIADLEQKLRTTEREAGVREDALRHEVTELRKRWQDAVRRADALSMDVQSSTAPLLRQLESMERQGRARAAGWAELENRLRSELEETVIQNETISKERAEFKTKFTRLERSMKEHEGEANQSKRTIEEQAEKIVKLETQVEELQTEAEKRQDEYVKVERLANEGVMRVRSEMTQTVVDSEERYRGQITKLEGELKVEKDKRSQLENQLEQLLDNAGMMLPPQSAPEAIRRESKPKKLRQAEGQAAILAGALGFDSDDDSSDDDDDDFVGNGAMDRGDGAGNGGGMSSFAALEQLTSRLKAATLELDSLKKSLRESEKERESLAKELGESLAAKEKLPLFEAKVQELTADNREKELEIQGLRDDISDVKELYRTQLSMLLEEKATVMSTATTNGKGPTSMIDDEPKPETTEQPPIEENENSQPIEN